ncbi:MAG: hypothetical protein Q8L24_01045 [bacterium]|nr:hypothetical protein [bacterium]
MNDVISRLTFHPRSLQLDSHCREIFASIMAFWSEVASEVSKKFNLGPITDGVFHWKLDLREVASFSFWIDARVDLLREENLKNSILIRPDATIPQAFCEGLGFYNGNRGPGCHFGYKAYRDVYKLAEAVVARLNSTRG